MKHIEAGAFGLAVGHVCFLACVYAWPDLVLSMPLPAFLFSWVAGLAACAACAALFEVLAHFWSRNARPAR